MSGEGRDVVPVPGTSMVGTAIQMMPIEELKKLTAYVNEVKKALMIAGKDYVVDGDRQYTCRSGFAKLAQGFVVSDEPPIIKKVEYDEPQTWRYKYRLRREWHDGEFTSKVFGFEAVVRVIQLSTGRFATGEGACTVYELATMNKLSPRWYHDCQATAKTRAYNRAVSNFVGSADVSAEEMGFEAGRRHVESSQHYKLPEDFTMPPWNFERTVIDQGWDKCEALLLNWISDSQMDVQAFEAPESDTSRLWIRPKTFLGDSFGDVSKMLAAAGLKWRPGEKRWVLMRPEEG